MESKDVYKGTYSGLTVRGTMGGNPKSRMSNVVSGSKTGGRQSGNAGVGGTGMKLATRLMPQTGAFKKASTKDQSRVSNNKPTAAAGGLGFQGYGNPWKASTAQTQKDTSTKTRDKFYGGKSKSAIAAPKPASKPKAASSGGKQKVYGGSFSSAFNQARIDGAKTFGWSGKPGMSFSTKMANSGSSAKKVGGGTGSSGSSVKKTSGGTSSTSRTGTSSKSTSSGATRIGGSLGPSQAGRGVGGK
jgi:hypothetical protein